MFVIADTAAQTISFPLLANPAWPSNENLIISSRSNEIGSVIERINNFSYQGNRLDISFTAKYVIDAIRALGCDEITFLFNGDTKSFVVKSNKDESIIQLIQPVRTA